MILKEKLKECFIGVMEAINTCNYYLSIIIFELILIFGLCYIFGVGW